MRAWANGGHRKAGGGQLAALVQLVLGEELGARRRHEPVAGTLERAQVLGIEPLELERDDVDLGRECLQHRQVAVVSDQRLRAGAHRRVAGPRREHERVQVKRDRRRDVHSRKLAGTEDAEARTTGP